MARIAGVDYGLRRIGVAVSDVDNLIATPLGTIAHTYWRDDARRLAAMLAPYSVKTIVLGDPLLESGAAGAQSKETHGFGDALIKSGFEVKYMEEVYSSVEAIELLRESMYNARETRRRVDMAAAAVILTRYMNAT